MSNPIEVRNNRSVRRIRMIVVKDALRRMSNGYAVDQMWKCFDDVGACWLTNLFNKILSVYKMPSDWRRSTIIPIYKNKRDIQNCTNYRGIELMSNTMKL